jgi:GTP-binding protein HflX
MEKVITVGLQTPAQSPQFIRESMDELYRLADTAGGVVVYSLIQKRERLHPATLLGKGKVKELAHWIRQNSVRTVIFDQELKPVQQRNLEEALAAKVVDRTRLILDIFAQRARTREGQLQVELAQLRYLLPRITEVFGRFEQQTGGIGTRGPGERKLEVDRRRIRERMALLQTQIEKIRQEREIQRTVRRSVPVPQVALVGYTNAGKSTLLNTLLKLSGGAPKAASHGVYADDKLFATLDPTTRRVRLPSGRVILFSDTVGFIRKLPTELVAAFRATLEEVANADFLLVVVDASDPAWEDQEKTVSELLTKLEIQQLPRLTAYNKMDRLPLKKREIFARLDGLLISAESGKGVKDLLATVEDHLSSQWVEKDLMFSYNEGARLAQIHENMDVLSQEMTEKGIRVRVRTHPATLAHWLAKKPH